MGEERRIAMATQIARIDERTACLPQMQKDVACLSKKVAVVEVKSGIWGTIGGFIAVFVLWFKKLYGIG